MSAIVEIATKVSTPLALGGLVATLLFYTLHQILAKNIFPKFTKAVGAGIVRLIIERMFRLTSIAMVLGFAGFLVKVLAAPQLSLYRVRVTVTDPQGTPVDDAQVWSSLGGEPKRVAGGWEFEIPVGRKPTDGKLTVFAAAPSAFLKGRAELVLARDYNPAVIIPLQKDTAANVRGLVVDESGGAVAGARVSIAGHDGVLTDGSGGFLLLAHAAEGQQILLHIEKDGYRPLEQWHLAGDEPAHLTLSRRSGTR